MLHPTTHVSLSYYAESTAVSVSQLRINFTKLDALIVFRYLDAKRKGGIARFVNHSCDPTCRLEQWTAMGRPRCAVFSLRGMEAGEVCHSEDVAAACPVVCVRA